MKTIWALLIMTFVCVAIFEYYVNGWTGVGAVTVGYIFGWHGKKWYNGIMEIKNDYR